MYPAHHRQKVPDKVVAEVLRSKEVLPPNPQKKIVDPYHIGLVDLRLKYGLPKLRECAKINHLICGRVAELVDRAGL